MSLRVSQITETEQNLPTASVLMGGFGVRYSSETLYRNLRDCLGDSGFDV